MQGQSVKRPNGDKPAGVAFLTLPDFVVPSDIRPAVEHDNASVSFLLKLPRRKDVALMLNAEVPYGIMPDGWFDAEASELA
jgi:hypothetical protein